MKKIFVVNGRPRAGKDTFAELLSKFTTVHKISIIDPIKTAAIELGWKGGKTEQDRKFLADLKDLTDAYSNAAIKYIEDKVIDFEMNRIEEEVLLIDARNPDDIDIICSVFGAESVFINNPRVPTVTSNKADANVETIEYDHTINNTGSLKEYEQLIEAWYHIVIKNDIDKFI